VKDTEGKGGGGVKPAPAGGVCSGLTALGGGEIRKEAAGAGRLWEKYRLGRGKSGK